MLPGRQKPSTGSLWHARLLEFFSRGAAMGIDRRHTKDSGRFCRCPFAPQHGQPQSKLWPSRSCANYHDRRLRLSRGPRAAVVSASLSTPAHLPQPAAPVCVHVRRPVQCRYACMSACVRACGYVCVRTTIVSTHCATSSASMKPSAASRLHARMRTHTHCVEG